MKPKEKKMIFVLIVILVIAIIIFITSRNKTNESSTNNDTNINTNINKNNTTVVEENKVEEFVNEIEEGIKINTSTKLKTEKKVEGLTIKNISFIYNNGKSEMVADVVNNSNKKTTLMEVVITLIDKNGKELTKMNGLIEGLNPGESTKIDIGTTADVSNAYDFTIVKK